MLQRLVLVIVSLGLCELILLAGGYPAWWHPAPAATKYFDSDPELSWRLRPGSYSYAVSGKRIEVHVTGDFRRRSRLIEGTGLQKAALFGDSYVEGWGLDDRDTIAWILNEKVLDRDFLNYGVAKYGTYQSYLKLQQVLAVHPDLTAAIYLFNDFHESRNVGAPSWLMMDQGDGKQPVRSIRAAVMDPHGEIKDLRLRPVVMWQLSRRLRVVALLNDVFNELQARSRTAQKEAVTKLLLRKMNSAAQAKNVPFIVVLFRVRDTKRQRYKEFLAQSGIEYLDCSFEEMNEPEFVHLGLHTNRAANVRIADCLTGTPLIGGAN